MPVCKSKILAQKSHPCAVYQAGDLKALSPIRLEHFKGSDTVTYPSFSQALAALSSR